MKNLFLLGALVFISCSVLAQEVQNAEIVKSRLEDLGEISNQNPTVRGFDNREGDVVGTQYLYDVWMPASIVLADGTRIDDVEIKFDLYNRYLEIKYKEEVRVGDRFEVKEFVIASLSADGQGGRFVSLANHKSSKSNLGFGEVLYSGNVTLVRHYFLIVKDPDYVASLDMGSRDTKLIKKDEMLLIQDGVIEELSLQSFLDKKDEVKAFMKKNNLKLKEEKDVIEIVAYYDSLRKGTKAPAGK